MAIECSDDGFALAERLSHAGEAEIELRRITRVAIDSRPGVAQIKKPENESHHPHAERMLRRCHALVFEHYLGVFARQQDEQ